MSAADIEAELKKIVGENSVVRSSEPKKTHEIEADLKRMLNMPTGVVVTKEDLLDIKWKVITVLSPLNKLRVSKANLVWSYTQFSGN